MSPSERHRIDWRGWIALAWVVWFGSLYGRTVIETRGGKLRAAVARVMGSAQFARTPDPGRVASDGGTRGFSIVKASSSRPETSNAR